MEEEALVQLRVTRENLVPLTVLSPYFILGLLSFTTAPALLWQASSALEAGAYRHPLLLAVVHLYALGWGTAIALGALQQLSPVLAGSRLYSLKLARAAFIVLVAGLASLLAGFFTFQRAGFTHAAALLPLALLLAFVNVFLTQRGAPMTRQGVMVRPYVRSAALYLLLTALAGGALALHLATGWLGPRWLAVFGPHVTFGAAGWFLMLVLGISYHMLPFFGLTEKKRIPRWIGLVRRLLHGAIGLFLLNAWLTAFSLEPAPATAAQRNAFSLAAPLLGPIALALLILGLAAFLVDNHRLFEPRPANRMFPIVGYIRAAHIYLGLMAAAFATAAFLPGPLPPKAVTALGFLTAAGWLSNSILGYLHRILPFYVWHNKYWDRAKEPGIPAFRDMVDSRAAWVGCIVYNAGVAATLASFATPLPMTAGLAIMFIGGAVSAGNLLRMYWL